MTRKQKALSGILIIIVAAAIAVAVNHRSSAPSPQNNTQKTDQQATVQVQAGFDKKQYSLDDPTSLWVVVNKQRPLPSTYSPQNLVSIADEQLQSVAADQLKALIAAAAKDGVSLKGISGYRSYSTQNGLYNAYVAKDGQQQADTYSARPGHSEHQSGLAIDLGNSNGSCDLEECFGNTAGGKWMAIHSHEYGFIIRYASDKTNITGYQYEPWHIRYVGKDLANELYTNKQTMEEFFGLPAAPSY